MKARRNSISSEAWQSQPPQRQKEKTKYFFAVAIGRKVGVFATAREARENVSAVSTVCIYGIPELASGGSRAKGKRRHIVLINCRRLPRFPRCHSHFMFFLIFSSQYALLRLTDSWIFKGLLEKVQDEK
jgi:hypothetical protein